MSVRPATKADIPIVAAVLAASFGPDPLFQVMFPYQSQYPQAYVQALEEYLWCCWYDYSKCLFVSYYESPTEDQQLEGGPGEEQQLLLRKMTPLVKRNQILTGVAEFERVGKGWEHVYGVWGRLDPRLLIKPILRTFYTIRRRLFGNKAAAQRTPDNPSPLTYWNFLPSIIPFSSSFFSAPHRQTHWSLENLAVHPNHQGKGFGSKLVKQVLQVAKDDPVGDLPVCVVAADGKEGFYKKSGFEYLVGWISRTTDANGRDNPLRANGVGGGAVLWTR
ncbi:hypothetical protein LTR99_009757 [Exophiala xenobiotica]|uniref:N-acetyltransferase domain-containing protein n=1 Tax=Vermiconidia calcicola TaxID=1690605 RepID=A0AAV9PWQ9_9PEZI|nr:hypothetical protein LTR96_007115 [Exophiala xenobiotica]KAK5530596.1 hypothetical protein LTR25_009174 [Vermiconidia calcicola]KAK5532179.1 hypothetical protein LTR23_009621 [Chaetothyriales sp. CCFEE 6169]KAK5294359.1 hypothetical protein LTR99_009757 [Exophiala xenobiotica]KAK5336252.1 hypothetical protein LTR98_007582 [Exophiala xenobiotica]